MHADLENIGWTEEQWNRICTTVTEEAQKARVAAQILPLAGPEDPSTVAVPFYTLGAVPYAPAPAPRRLVVDSNPTLFLTTIAINVQLRTTEAADPELKAAMVMFRRAANHIARIEDALVFNGRAAANTPPPAGLAGIPPVYTVTGDGTVPGIFRPYGFPNNRIPGPVGVPPPALGLRLVSAVARAVSDLERRGQLGPYVCVLGEDYFDAVCDPTANLVLPRDRILPFLQGPLVRCSAIPRNRGTVIATSGSPIELIVASDIHVRFLQTTLEPRFVFRVSERVALRIKETGAISILQP